MAAAIWSRSRPSSTTPRSRPACRRTRSSTSAPLSRPPATHTTESNAARDAAAACGFVALESSTYATSSTVATRAMRCGSGRNPRNPSRTAEARTPAARASAAAARALSTWCGASVGADPRTSSRLPSSAADVRRSSTNARSARTSSTTPTMPTEGTPRVKPTARQPSTTSASRTSCSVRGSATLYTQAFWVRWYTSPLSRAYASSDPCQSTWSGATLRTALASGDTECSRSGPSQCSWKLDSSTARTSYGSGCTTASSSGVPTLPAATARSPAACSIDVSIRTVVVLPLVPVSVSQGAAPSRRRIRQASSTSPHTGTPACWAATSSGWSGRQPGEVTTTSGRCGRRRVASSPRCSSTPRMRSSSPRSPRSVRPSTTLTRAPRWISVSAAANPLTPAPATTTSSPDQSSSALVRVASRSRLIPPLMRGLRGVVSAASDVLGFSRAHHPLRVEDAQRQRHEQAGDDPEPDDDGDLLPAEQLEVVLERRHPEDPLAGQLERANLQDDRQGDQDEQAADDEQQDLGAAGDRQPGERAAEGQRAGVAHEDLGR